MVKPQASKARAETAGGDKKTSGRNAMAGRARLTRANSITSSSARARPAACSPTASAPTASIRCCCWRRVPRDRNMWIHIPIGYGKAVQESEGQLDVPDRAGAGARRPPGVSAARQGARRLELDQRPGLYPRPACGLRRWRQLGNVGWGFDDMLPYFRKAENQQRGADEYHGVGGPLNVSDPAPDRSVERRLHRGGDAGRHSRQQRLQRRRARRARATTRRPRATAAAARRRAPTCARRVSGRT